jgi:mono/diheme cytochrome c family protein
LSRASALRVLLVVVTLPAFGCWEQMSVEWWPQMKWQIAVQAFSETGQPSAPGGFVPPEGTVPIGAVRSTSTMPLAETEALQNPVPASLVSLQNGKKQFETFCGPCHGLGGLGDGPVAGPPFGKGPLLGVLPVAGPVGSQITKNFSDGHIYTVISQGIRRMPAYRRIPPDHRWDIVNYVRYMNGQLPGAQTAQAAPAAAPQQGGAQQ